MKEAMERFGLYAKDVNLEEPKKHLLLNTTGNLYQGDLKKHMEMQIVSSVHFYQSVEKAMELGVDTFVEVAPKSVLKSMVKKVNRKINVLTISSVDELEQVVGLL
jgi:[acyl-carrier-protein] S-malonyltransferase